MHSYSDDDLRKLLSAQIDRKARRLDKLNNLEEHADWFSAKVYGVLAWVVARRLSELLLARAALSAIELSHEASNVDIAGVQEEDDTP